MDLVELQLNWNVVEEISEVNKKKMALNKLSAATMIQSKVDINKGKLLIAFAAQISCISSEDARLVTYAIEQLKLLAFAFSTSRIDLKYSGVWKGVSGSIKGLQRNRQKIDNFLKRSVMIQASKVEQAGGEDSVVLENQSDYDSTQDGMKKGKDNSKGKKSKKSKGKKSKGKKRWF